MAKRRATLLAVQVSLVDSRFRSDLPLVWKSGSFCNVSGHAKSHPEEKLRRRRQRVHIHWLTLLRKFLISLDSIIQGVPVRVCYHLYFNRIVCLQ
jgi:hypothetical protein